MSDDKYTTEEETQPFGRSICHVCSGTEFTWGKAANYAAAGTAFVDENQALLFPQADRVRARLCHRCGNIQFFVDVSGE